MAALLAGLVGVSALLRSERAERWACGELERRVPEATGLELRFGACRLERLQLVLRDVTLGTSGQGPRLVTAEEASVSVAGVFSGGVDLGAVRLVRPRVVYEVPSGGAPRAPGCPLDALAHVRVGRLEVEAGALQLGLPDGRWLRLDGIEVAASVDRVGLDVEASARSGAFTLQPGQVLALGRLKLEGGVDGPARVATVRKLEFNVEGANAQVAGRVESLCDAVPQLVLTTQAFLPVPALTRLGLAVDVAQGQVWARATVSGRADAPTARAEVQASQVVWGPFAPGDFTARLAVGQGVLHVEELTTRVGDGTLTVTGEADLTAGLPVRLKVDASGVPFGKTLERAGRAGSWVDFLASVKATITGHVLPTPELEGEADVRATRFTLASRAWNAPAAEGRTILEFPEAVGSFRLKVGADAVTFKDVALHLGDEGHTRVAGLTRLFYDARRGIEVRLDAPTVDLSDFGHIAGLPWEGQGAAAVTVLGPYADIVVDGQLSLRDFKFAHYALGVVQGPVRYLNQTLSFPSVVAQKGHTQYFGTLDLVFGGAALWTRAAVQLPEGRVEDVVDLLADLSPTLQNLQGPLTGKISAVASFDSPASEFAGLIAMQVTDVEYFGRRFGAAQSVLRFERGDEMRLDPCEFEGPLGRLHVGGSWLFAGPLDYQLSLEGGDLGELIDPRGEDGTGLTGTFTSTAQVFGDTNVIRVQGHLGSPAVRWKGRGLGKLALDLDETGRDMDISGQVIDGLTGTMQLHARNDWPYTARFAVELPELAPFLPARAEGVKAGLAGEVVASGPLKSWRDSAVELRLDRFTVARGEVQVANVGPVRAAWRNGGAVVQSLTLKGPTTEIAAEGTWGPTVADLRTRGSIDLRLLSSLAPDLERTSGRLDFTASFSGPARNPGVAGSAELSEGRLALKGQDLQIRALTGRADFSESRVMVQELNGFLNDGRVKIRGDARLDHLSLSTVQIGVDLEDVTVQIKPEVPITVSAALLFAQKGGKSLLSGNVEVVRFRYTQPLALDTLLANTGKRSLPQDEKPQEWLWFDVNATAGDEVRVENNLARARLAGKVKLSGTNVKPVLIGAIEATEGAQAFFRGNTFAVSRALLQFNGQWPTLDLAMQSQVREYLVSVKAFGKLEDPKLSLSSEPSLSEADILSLLTLGVTTRESLQTQGGAGLAAEALMSVSGLDQQVQKFLQRSVGLKDQQVRLTTTFNETTGTTEPSVTWESKVLDNWKVGITQPVTGKGTRAQAEYRHNQKVSAKAQWDNQTSTSPVGNFGADVRFRFEWE